MDTVLYTGSQFKLTERMLIVFSEMERKYFMLATTLRSEEKLLISQFTPAKRVKNLKPSGIRRFFQIAQETPDAINLSVGEPDFCPPRYALEAGWQAAKEGKTHYAPTNGIPELRKALAEKAYHEYGLKYDPDSEILITVGGTEAVFLALTALIDPGSEVLLPNPGFVLYQPSTFLTGGVPVSIPLLEANEFRPSIDDVTSLITKKSRVMILNFPNNPTGAILSHDEIAGLTELAVNHDMIVVCDEVYEKIIYDDARHNCLATFPKMPERTLIVNSFSKTYAMTGLRVGYVYGPKELISALWLVHQYTVACVDTLSQYVALAALTGPQNIVKDMVAEFDKRRLLVYKRLNEIEDINCSLPKGAFYVFPNIKKFGMSSEDFAEFLAKEAKVITVPGSAFGSHGEGYIRISYAASYRLLEEAMNRIEKAVKKTK
jgi:aminotransferase